MADDPLPQTFPAASEKDFLHRIPRGVFYAFSMGLLLTVLLFAYFTPLTSNYIGPRELHSVIHAPDFGDLSYTRVRRLFSEPRDGVYSPFYLLSLSVDAKIWSPWGLRTLGFHVSQFLLLALSVTLVMMILQKTFHHRLLALAGALLFAVFPAHTQTIADVSLRGDLMAMTASLTAVFFFMQFLAMEDWRWRGANGLMAWIFAFVAMACSPRAAVLPALLVLYHLSFGIRRRGFINHLQKILRKAHYHLPFVILAIVMTGGHHLAATLHDPKPDAPASIHFIPAATSFVDYVRSCFDSSLLNPFHPAQTTSVTGGQIAAGLGVVAALGTVLLALFQFNRLMFFALTWFCVALIPHLTWTYSAGHSDHGLSLALLGPATALAYGIYRLWVIPYRPWLFRSAGIFLFALVMSHYASETRAYASLWLDGATVWGRVAEKYPNDPCAHFELAQFYREQGNMERAAAEYRETLQAPKKNPYLLTATVELASIFLEREKYPEALRLTSARTAENPPQEESDEVWEQWSRLYSIQALCREGANGAEAAVEDFQNSLAYAEKIRSPSRRAGVVKPVCFALGRLYTRSKNARAADFLNQSLDSDPENIHPPDNIHALALLVDQLLRDGKAEAAVQITRAHLARGNQRARMYLLLGNALLRAGQDQAGAEALRQAVETNPKDAPTRFDAARVFIFMDRWDEAETVIRDGFAYPSFVPAGTKFLYDLYYDKVNALLNAGDGQKIMTQGVDYLKRAVALDTSDLRASLLLADLYFKAQKFPEALAVREDLLQRDPDNTEFLAQRAETVKHWGYALNLTGQRKEALEKFKRYLQLVPAGTDTRAVENNVRGLEQELRDGEVSAWIEAAETDYKAALELSGKEQEDQFLKAMEKLNSAEAAQPDNGLIHYMKGMIFKDSGKIDQALKSLLRCIAVTPDTTAFPEPLFWTGKLAGDLGDEETQESLLTRYLNESSSAAHPQGDCIRQAGLSLFDLGKSQAGKNRHESAARCFESALFLAADADYASLHYYLGAELAAIHDLRGARARLEQYQKNVNFDGDFSIECRQLAQRLDEQINAARADHEKALDAETRGNLDEAVRHAQASLATDPFHAPYREKLGDLFYAREQWEKSLAEYEKIYLRDPVSPGADGVYFKAGRVFFRMGRLKRAQSHLDLYLSRAPDGEFAADARALLDEIRKKEK